MEPAAKAGATLGEVLETVEVGIEMGGGPAHGLGPVCPGGQRGGIRP